MLSVFKVHPIQVLWESRGQTSINLKSLRICAAYGCLILGRWACFIRGPLHILFTPLEGGFWEDAGFWMGSVRQGFGKMGSVKKGWTSLPFVIQVKYDSSQVSRRFFQFIHDSRKITLKNVESNIIQVKYVRLEFKSNICQVKYI